MKEYLTRREAIKLGAAFLVGGISAGGASRELIDKDKSFSTSDVAGIAGMIIGLSAAGAGVRLMLDAAVDNLPADDQGNARELISFTESDHMLGGMHPIYGALKNVDKSD